MSIQVSEGAVRRIKEILAERKEQDDRYVRIFLKGFT
jgi:Fe-S cluster assembly iron-binding protein IscA